VLTKSDAVDAETLEVVRLEVEEFLRGTFLETQSPWDNPKSLNDSNSIVAVSSLTGAGLEELKRRDCCSSGRSAAAGFACDRAAAD